MYISIELPPGVYRNGTEYQSAGRYYDANLVRWRGRSMQPIGGWQEKSATTVTGSAREMITWRDNGNQVWAGIGTHSGLYVMTNTGIVHDITPANFTSGRSDAETGAGYGIGNYGAGAYGLPRPSTTTVLPASVWSLDTWGENLVGVMPEDATIYEWTLGTGTPAAAVANAPDCRCILATPERVLMAFGCDGNPRLIKWSDQEDNTNWTPTALNYSGDFEIATTGTILAGVKTKDTILIFTDTDVWRAEFLGPPLIYAFPVESDGAGIVSANAAAVIDGSVLWMGPESFWAYSGYVSKQPCDVEDYIFSNINTAQISKVVSFHNSSFNEVWWFYPDAESTENNRYVSFNYADATWSIGEIARLAACDISPFPFPMMADSDGQVWDHEVGTSHRGSVAFARGGPLELNDGNTLATALEYIPDEKTTGDVETYFYTRNYPNGTETEYGPYTSGLPTDVRLTARQIEVKHSSTGSADWRVGTPRVRVRPRGRR